MHKAALDDGESNFCTLCSNVFINWNWFFRWAIWTMVSCWDLEAHLCYTCEYADLCYRNCIKHLFLFTVEKKYLYYTSVYQKYILLVLKCRDKKTTTHTLTIDTFLTHILSISMVSSRGQVLRIQNRVIFFRINPTKLNCLFFWLQYLSVNALGCDRHAVK